MSKIIIFEGQDRCFKSTNVKRLFNHFTGKGETCHMLHYSGIKGYSPQKTAETSKKIYTEMFRLFKYFHSQNINVICDRSHLGENVYAGYKGYSGSYIWALEHKFTQEEFWDDVHLIYLHTSIDDMLSRDDGNSITIDENKLKFERQKFDEAFCSTYIKKKFGIDILNKSKDEIFNEILIKLKEPNINKNLTNVLTPYIDKADMENVINTILGII